MNQIHAGQIKMARAYLNWSQEDLASATGLSISTIRKLELGTISPRNSTYNVIRHAIEIAGLEFIEADGIRRRREEVIIIDGPESSEDLYDDLLQTIKKKGGRLEAVVFSQGLLIRALGGRMNAHDRLEKLSDAAEMDILISDEVGAAGCLPGVQFRAIPRHYIGPVPYFIYGDKYAHILSEGPEAFRFVIFQSASVAQSYRTHFRALWDYALPLGLSEASSTETRAG